MSADRYRAGKRLWSKQDDAIMRRDFPNQPSATLAARLRRTVPALTQRATNLGLRKSAAYMASPAACRLRRGQGPDHPGYRTQFKKGQPSHNKGLRRPGWFRGRMRETQYQRGCRSGKAAQHWMPIGATRLIDGYLYRKVSDVPNVAYTVNWKPEHVLLWTAAHGAVPPGHALKFVNGDRADVRIDNLQLFTRRTLMALNTIHHLPKPLVQTINALGALKRRIRERTERYGEK